MTRIIRTTPLTSEAFVPFGDVLECAGAPDKLINQGLCGRFHDRAKLDFSDGHVGISLFNAQLRSLPYMLDMVERHHAGSQAFVPMSIGPFLVVVAPDTGGTPDTPLAFVTAPGQGINLHRNIWHGVLAPLQGTGVFSVIDRIGDGENLEEHWFKVPYRIE